MEIFTELRENFSKYFDLMITDVTIESFPPINSPNGNFVLYKTDQEMKVTLQPLPSKNKTIQLVLSLSDDMLKADKLDFDTDVAHIPDNLLDNERVIARIGYIIYQAYKSTQSTSMDDEPPKYLKKWNIVSQYYY